MKIILISDTTIVARRMIRPWLQSDIIFKRTKDYKIQLEARSKSSLIFTDEIIKNGLIYRENFVNDDEKLQNSVEAMFEPCHNLTVDEIREEINTIIIAVRVLKYSSIELINLIF